MNQASILLQLTDDELAAISDLPGGCAFSYTDENGLSCTGYLTHLDIKNMVAQRAALAQGMAN